MVIHIFVQSVFYYLTPNLLIFFISYNFEKLIMIFEFEFLNLPLWANFYNYTDLSL